MYKNAEKVLDEFGKVSQSQIRGAVTKARIEQNVRNVKSMIHLIQPASHSEVILPNAKTNTSDVDKNDTETNQLRSEERQMKVRLLKSAAMVPVELQQHARPLDPHSIQKWVSRMDKATENANDINKQEKNHKKHKKQEHLSQTAISALETKLQLAIRGEYRAEQARLRQKREMSETVSTSPKSPIHRNNKTSTVNINTRALLPHYRLEDVHQFMDNFAKVDENCSGDLDVNEWIRLFTSLNESIPEHEARMIFMRIDKDSDGFLTIRELVPVIFSRANKDQQAIIIQYLESQLSEKHGEDIPTVTILELTQLFEAYDINHIGYVEVALIRERVKDLRMNEQVLFAWLDSISNMADDEMVNLAEFLRMFKSITRSKSN